VKPRILVIRGGAIGDFILTLPAIHLLREAFPGAHLEILGYKHIVALAEERFYANATRSIEYGALAGFFTLNSTLSPELAEYFASFQQIVSYLYDPDGVFEGNLRRAGVKNTLAAYQRIDDSEHAAEQLARPLQKLALYLEDHAARIFPSEADRTAASQFLTGFQELPIVAMHPGSGSPKKNWPLDRWEELGWRILEKRPGTRLMLIGGEADQTQIEALKAAWKSLPLLIARELPLPHLAAVIERCRLFVGHDSGISHLAAAVGTPCLLLFGPTDPSVWAPANPAVSILEAPEGELSGFSVETVSEKAAELL
jgi:heptosyltransferase-3